MQYQAFPAPNGIFGAFAAQMAITSTNQIIGGGGAGDDVLLDTTAVGIEAACQIWQIYLTGSVSCGAAENGHGTIVIRNNAGTSMAAINMDAGNNQFATSELSLPCNGVLLRMGDKLDLHWDSWAAVVNARVSAGIYYTVVQ